MGLGTRIAGRGFQRSVFVAGIKERQRRSAVGNCGPVSYRIQLPQFARWQCTSFARFVAESPAASCAPALFKVSAAPVPAFRSGVPGQGPIGHGELKRPRQTWPRLAAPDWTSRQAPPEPLFNSNERSRSSETECPRKLTSYRNYRPTFRQFRPKFHELHCITVFCKSPKNSGVTHPERPSILNSTHGPYAPFAP